jgi:hypothetical protein
MAVVGANLAASRPSTEPVLQTGRGPREQMAPVLRLELWGQFHRTDLHERMSRRMKKWMIALAVGAVALAAAVPTISATLTHNGSPALNDAPPTGLSLDIMYWTSIDPETGQPGGGCAAVLAWRDNSNGEIGFRIERRRDDTATWQPIGEAAPDITGYRDAGVCGGACYRVAALGVGGLSAYSNEACYGPEGPAPVVTAATVTITGAVMDVSLSAHVITLAESVEGFDAVALTDETRLVSPSGGEATLRDVRPGMRIQTSGRTGESGALLADVVLILSDEAPTPTAPPLEVS